MDEIKDPELKSMLENLKQQNIEQSTKAMAATNAQRTTSQMSMFENNQSDIIRWQLDLSSELERIEHILRGHMLIRDNTGNEVWADPCKEVILKGYKNAEGYVYWIYNETDKEKSRQVVAIVESPDKKETRIYDKKQGELFAKELKDVLNSMVLTSQKMEQVVDSDKKPFNEYGVQLLMSVINFYINKNTILSNYDEETINSKMLGVGNEINDLLYLKYEEMGMDTAEKRRLYFMIIREICDSIHSCYMRAFGGEERESLRKVITYSQIDNNPQPKMLPSGFNRKKMGFWQSLANAPV